MNQITIKQIIGHGMFIGKTLLDVVHFVRYCNDRGINISAEQLEAYERLGIFLPLFRLQRPKIKTKIEERENGVRYGLGMLEEGENWDGEVEEKYGVYVLNAETVDEISAKGSLWSPTLEQYKPWESFKDTNNETTVESYYSIFQAMPLREIERLNTFKIGIENLSAWEPEQAAEWFKSRKELANKLLSKIRETRGAREELAALCQVLSNRYLPYAEKYEGMISLPPEDFFDWPTYRQNWNARQVLKELNLTVEEVASFHRLARMEAKSDDPLDHWGDLVKFVRREKKEKLKGEALLGQSWRVMERLISLFNRDLTGKELYTEHNNPEYNEVFYGKGVPQDELKLLEFVANKYGVNPRPKLVLFVEGKGEFTHFPRLATELFGIVFSELRIHIRNLGGVGEYEGREGRDKYGAFEKLIEDYHDKQTIAFFILDSESRVADIKQQLITSPSKLHPNRTFTKNEYIKLWDKNVEFDNFTDKEIADAMTEFSENRYQFTEAEIEDCRNRFGGRDEGDNLTKLYKSKFADYKLNKVKLLGILVDHAVLSPNMMQNGAELERPLIETIREVCDLAIGNPQPSNLDAWEETQNSEWLGHEIT